MGKKEKLVRDGYVGLIEPSRLRIASEEEMSKLLREKYWEEFWEVQNARSDTEFLTELGDLAQVIMELEARHADSWWHHWLFNVITRTHGVLNSSIDYYRHSKLGECGGFSQGLVFQLEAPENNDE